MRCRFGSDAKRGLRSERGVVAVEFAIILPVLLLLLAGLFDLGWAFYWSHTVTNASRAGSRYGVQAIYADGINTPLTVADITKIVKDSYGADLVVNVVPGSSSGTPLSVTVEKPMHWFFSGVLTYFGVTLPMTVKNTTTMTME